MKKKQPSENFKIAFYCWLQRIGYRYEPTPADGCINFFNPKAPKNKRRGRVYITRFKMDKTLQTLWLEFLHFGFNVGNVVEYFHEEITTWKQAYQKIRKAGVKK